MRETILKLNTWTPKKSKNGKDYHEFDTDQGKYTAWECGKELSKFEGKLVKVKVDDHGKWKNIKDFLGEATDEEAINQPKPTVANMSTLQATANSEPVYRVNIKQTAKGHHYYELTVRADTEEELNDRLERATDTAVLTCQKLNTPVMPDDQEPEDQKEEEQ